MSELSFMCKMRSLPQDEWQTLKDVRLAALKDSPDLFFNSYAKEYGFDESDWRAEFNRGEWHIGERGGRSISLLGCTRDASIPDFARNLEYLWVSPEARNKGVAYSMVMHVLARLRAADVRTAFLWVLDGNEPAIRLYKRIGFVSSNHSQPSEDRPGHWERMHLNLT
jgi:ribosomal protein S18 acetylase RimI-like enzyme